MRTIHAIAAVAVAASSGCSAVLYYGFPETRTRDVERTSRVVVRSAPAGAIVSGPGGEVLGAAPLETDVSYKVRHTSTRHSATRAAIGCAIDSAALVGGTIWSVKQSESVVADAAFYGGLGLFTGCFALAFVKALNVVIMEPYYRTTQAPLLLSSPVKSGDDVIGGELIVDVRWIDGGRARTVLRAPGQSEALARQPPARTFDEALLRYDETRGEPLKGEGLYRRGRAYRDLARNGGGASAAVRAIAALERYLTSGAINEARAGEVREMLDELRPMARAAP